MTAHSSLTGTSLHENKGVEDADDNFVATASANATVWKKIDPDNIDQTSVFNVNKAYVTLYFPDVSVATKIWMTVPFAGTLTKVDSVLNGPITVADAIVTVKDNDGNSAGNFTVAFTGSAAGDQDSLSPVSNNTFAAGEKLSIESDGGSTDTQALYLTLTFTITG